MSELINTVPRNEMYTLDKSENGYHLKMDEAWNGWFDQLNFHLSTFLQSSYNINSEGYVPQFVTTSLTTSERDAVNDKNAGWIILNAQIEEFEGWNGSEWQNLSRPIVQVLTTAERDALASTPQGLLIYNTTVSRLQGYIGAVWIDLST